MWYVLHFVKQATTVLLCVLHSQCQRLSIFRVRDTCCNEEESDRTRFHDRILKMFWLHHLHDFNAYNVFERCGIIKVFADVLHVQVSFFYNDYSTASGLATTFDNKIATDSKAAGGQNYVTLTSLAVRQAFGAIELCGTTNTTYVFLKEISSDGNVQTVDAVFPFHPVLVYANPVLLKLTLDPLFVNQEAGNWPFAFSIHDIGSHFPNATGHADGTAEQQPLEECGDMLIMTLAYAQRANDNAYLSQHYAILRQWNEYLVEEAIIPANQISTDDFAGSLTYVPEICYSALAPFSKAC